MRYVALLRGINVGGNNRIKMDELRALFESAGASNVQSYIQSGNVLFSGQTSVAKGVEAQLAERSIDTKLVLRSKRSFLEALDSDPFAAITEGAPEEKLRYLGFCLGPPKNDSLDAERSPGDRIAVAGTHVYLDVPGGMAKTKFTSAYVDRSLHTMVTFRNLRSCRAIAALF